MKGPILILLGIITTISGFSQHTISGYVRDSLSGELIIGAVVASRNLRQGTISNKYGFYSLTLKSSEPVTLTVDYPGYNRVIRSLKWDKDYQLNFDLSKKEILLDEVLITEQKARENVERPTMGLIDVNVEEIEALPFIGGEKDLLKAIQLLPGVQSGTEASAGFFVRGGNADQNLILMDEAVIYNPFHLAGFISLFNTDAIRSVDLYKGGFPANYGGRLSSTLDISMKDGNMREYHGAGGIGILSSKLTVEGPIVKDKVSFMLSGRRSYWDLLIRPLLPFGQTVGLNFQDANAKLNWRISEKDRIFISGYLGRDKLINENVTPFDTSRLNINWGNRTLTFRWNHLFSNKLFSNVSAIYSNYDYVFEQVFSGYGGEQGSRIEDLTGKIDFDYYPSPRHQIKFGAQYIFHRLTPTFVSQRLQVRDSAGNVVDSLIENTTIREVNEGAVYINDEITVSDRIGLNLGVRVPIFFNEDTTYYSIEPRATLKIGLNRNASIKMGYTLMNQYMHLVSSSTISNPFDIWTSSGREVLPSQAHQGAIGYFQNFANDKYESSVEVYYKHMYNLIDFREGARLFQDELEDQFTFGQGYSYGAEFYIRKRSGRLTGWIAYTLSWNWRQFDELNFGNPYPAKYDRRHDLALVMVYRFNENWSFSSVFVYGTGNSITVPTGRFYFPVGGWVDQTTIFNDYSERNGNKLNDYNRLDLGLRYEKQTGKIKQGLHIDIYNAYNRRNPFYVYLQPEFDERANASRFVGRQISLLPMLPSLTYVFEF